MCKFCRMHCAHAAWAEAHGAMAASARRLLACAFLNASRLVLQKTLFSYFCQVINTDKTST